MSDIRKNKGKGTAKAESKKARTAFSSQLAVCSKRLKSRCQISGKTKAKEQQKQKVKKQEQLSALSWQYAVKD